MDAPTGRADARATTWDAESWSGGGGAAYASSRLEFDPAVINSNARQEGAMKERTTALADRLEQGSRALADFASSLTEEECNTRIPHDGRTVGVVVHHVASVYPVEIGLAQTIAGGKPVIGVTHDVIDQMNATHAKQNHDVTKEETLALLLRNSTAAATAIRVFTEEDLDRA